MDTASTTRRLSWKDAHIMASVLAISLLGLWFLWGELIPVADGLGFGDGRTYGRLSIRFPQYLLGGWVDQYRMARVAPSLAVYISMNVLPLSPGPRAAVTLFRLMNVVVLVGSVYLWVSVARSWKLSRLAGWIGFIGLFVNFQNLKMSLYYPTLTDTVAFAIGMTLLFAFVHRNVWLTATVAVVSAFVSPPLFFAALLLLAIPRLDRSSPLRLTGRVIPMAWVFGATFGFGVGFWLFEINARFGGFLVSGGEEVWQGPFVLSVGVVVAYLVWASRPLWASLLGITRQDWRNWLGRPASIAWLVVRTAGALYIAVVAFAIYQIGSEVMARDTDVLLQRMIYEGVARPFMFVIGHVASFGPIILIAVFLWLGVVKRVHTFGPGLVLLFLGIIFLGLSSESRTITFALPFVAAFAAYAADELSWSATRVALLGGLALVVSRVWLPINLGPIDEGPYLEFPAQWYFMNFPPWMSNDVYWFATGFTIVVAILTYLIVRSARSGSMEQTTDAPQTTSV